jgi:hypothetical protein
MKNPSKLKALIALVSYTGKSGKSTTGNNLLYPRMHEPSVFRIETINESGLSGAGENEQKLKGRDIEKLLSALSKTDCAIVDVGTSNVEAFFLALAQQPDAHRIFDFFVVPIEANAAKVNEFKESVKTLTMLNKLGVESERIKVVFNKLATDSLIEDEMTRIFNFHKQYPIFSLRKNAVIHETQAFKALADAKKTYDEILGDQTDYWSLLKNTPVAEEVERTRLVKMARTQGLIKGLHTELDCVFNALFGNSIKISRPESKEQEIDVSNFD